MLCVEAGCHVCAVVFAAIADAIAPDRAAIDGVRPSVHAATRGHVLVCACAAVCIVVSWCVSVIDNV